MDAVAHTSKLCDHALVPQVFQEVVVQDVDVQGC